MNNQPAFPLHNYGAQTLGLHVTGMTLRDYFAAKAMQAYWNDPNASSGLRNAAVWSYEMADAMMEARK